MASLIFFLLLAVFVVAAMRSPRKLTISPDSQPGRVVESETGYGTEATGERMNIDALICTCNGWQQRRSRFATGTPMRLCEHLVSYFTRHINMLPASAQPLTRMILLMNKEKQGMPCGAGTEYGHLDEQAYVLYVVREPELMARLILGGRRYELRFANRNWLPGPPEQVEYFSLRARQLANAAFSKA